MTSDEIRNQELPRSNNIEFHYILEWLREIAGQLAVMNERQVSDQALVNQYLGSKVGADSDKISRGGHQEAKIPAGFAPYCRFCRVTKDKWEEYPVCAANLGSIRPVRVPDDSSEI